MKLNKFLLVGVASIGLLTMGGNSASAGGYFSAGNPGGLPGAPGYPLAHTPSSQAWERNNAWIHYRAQGSQVQLPSFSTGISGSTLHHDSTVTPRRTYAPVKRGEIHFEAVAQQKTQQDGGWYKPARSPAFDPYLH